MTPKPLRLLTGILLSVALAGTLASCGDGDGDARPAAADATPTATTGITAAPGEVDRAFVRQMIPHHREAVAMAERAGKQAGHAELKTLAATIIAAQGKELTELTAVAKDLDASDDAGTAMTDDAKTLALSMDDMGMSMDMAALETTDPDAFDRAFIDQMTKHHRGAVAMASAEIVAGENAGLQKLATAIVAAQQEEIAQMAAWRAEWFGEATPTADADAGSGAGSGDEPMEHMGH